MPEASREEFEECGVRLRVEVKNHLQLPSPEQRVGTYHYWTATAGNDAIYYDRAFCLRKRLRLEATGLLTDEPVIRANRTYYRYVSHRFMNLHSLAYLLTDLASLLLLRRGFAPLHCSAFRIGESTVVIAAPPNTGKTLTSVTACMKHHADYLAEDLAVTDGTDVFSVPWTSTFRYYKEIDGSLKSRLRNRVTRILPPLELLTSARPRPITRYIDARKVSLRSRVTHLVVLQRGEKSVRPIGYEEAFRKIRNLNRYEFNYHKAPLVVAHEFFNPELDIAGACRAEDAILRELVRNADHRMVVRSQDPSHYATMILDAIKQPLTVSGTERQVA